MKDYKDRLILDDTVLQALEYLQNEETRNFFDDVLTRCIRVAIEDPDAFSDEEALDIIRSLHTLRKALRELLPASSAILLPPASAII